MKIKLNTRNDLFNRNEINAEIEAEKNPNFVEVKKMLSEDARDCVNLIVQLKAIKSAMASLMEKVIADEFSYCLLDEKFTAQHKMEKIFKELINKN